MHTPSPAGGIELYQSPDGLVRVECRLDEGSLWLPQKLIAELFGKDVRTINEHLQNVFADGELQREATIRKFRIVQQEGSRSVSRPVEHFNLDAILSVGYRVNSRRGTQFRIWATQTLREHLVRGYTLNESRLLEAGLRDVQQAVTLLGRTLRQNDLVAHDGRVVLDIIESYTSAWHLLPAYDADQLSHVPRDPRDPQSGLTLSEARASINALRAMLASQGEPVGLFGAEHNQQLAGILGAIEQTFDGVPIYPSAQSRAAHLLYFLVKDHPFVDGNKRIGALLFLDYLRRIELLHLEDGRPRLDANAIVALTLLIAESDPRQKGLMIRLVLGMLDDGLSQPSDRGATARSAPCGPNRPSVDGSLQQMRKRKVASQTRISSAHILRNRDADRH